MVITNRHGASSPVIQPCRQRPGHAAARAAALTSQPTSFSAVTSFNPVDGWCMPLLSLIVALLLFCRGCMCNTQCAMSWGKVKDPCYVTISKNITRTVGVSTGGECLIMCGEHIYDICKSSNKGCELTSADCERRRKMRDAKTYFCGLPLDNVLSNDSRLALLSYTSESECRNSLDDVVQMDSRAHGLYTSFLDVLERVDCFGYSSSGSCERCKTAYKRWLCTVHLPFYHEGGRVRPCMDFCDNVAQQCPFFRPHGESQIGEPGFLCKNTFVDPTSSAMPDTCCYAPCHSFAPSSDCPPLAAMTSNCNGTSNSVKPLTPDLITCLSLCLLASWIHKTVLQYNCIGRT